MWHIKPSQCLNNSTWEEIKYKINSVKYRYLQVNMSFHLEMVLNCQCFSGYHTRPGMREHNALLLWLMMEFCPQRAEPGWKYMANGKSLLYLLALTSYVHSGFLLNCELLCNHLSKDQAFGLVSCCLKLIGFSFPHPLNIIYVSKLLQGEK